MVEDEETKMGTEEGKDKPAPFTVEGGQNPPPQQQAYAMPPQYPPQGQPYYGQPSAYPQQPSPPPQDMMSTIFWKSLWFLVLIGGILVLVGQIMLDVADYSDEGLLKGGRVLGTIAAFMIGVPMAITGIYYDRIGDVVRFGLILSGVLVLAFAFF